MSILIEISKLNPRYFSNIESGKLTVCNDSEYWYRSSISIAFNHKFQVISISITVSSRGYVVMM